MGYLNGETGRGEKSCGEAGLTQLENGVSVMGLQTAIAADIDIRSEVVRWMGPVREEVYAVKEIFKNRNHHLGFEAEYDEEVQQDDVEASKEDDFNFLMVMNTPYAGNKFLIAPGFSPTEKNMDSLAVSPLL